MPDDIKKIISILEPIVAEEACELVDVEMTSESGRKILRVSIDKEGGVIVDDCVRVSHAIEDILEVEDAVSGKYCLEVSSPGIDRPLRTLAHFQKAVEKMIRFSTREKIDGRQNYKGVLKSVDDTSLVISIDQKDFIIPLDQVVKARMVGEV